MNQISDAFDYYAERELNPSSKDMETRMRTSFTNFDVAASKKE